METPTLYQPHQHPAQELAIILVKWIFHSFKAFTETINALLIFSAPNNCQQFLICQRANSEPVVQNCEVGYYYNRDSRRCVRGNTCIKATCGTSLFATFGSSRNYYVLCVANQAPFVFRCPDNTLYTAGSNPPCVYRCTSDGWFANSEDNHSYYECSRNAALQFVQKQLVCPFQWTFDAVARVCSPPAWMLTVVRWISQWH
jgi:hypothetical protein